METSHALVKDVMRELLITVHPETERADAAQIFLNNRISGAPVIDSRGVLLGVVSMADLLKPTTGEEELLSTYFTQTELEQMMDETGFHLEAIPGLVETCYTRNPVTIHPDSPVTDAARLMLKHRIHRLIVVNPHEQIPVGILTSLDLVALVAEPAQSLTKNQGGKAASAGQKAKTHQ